MNGKILLTGLLAMGAWANVNAQVTYIPKGETVVYNGEDVNPSWGEIGGTTPATVENPNKTGNESEHCASITYGMDGTDIWSGGVIGGLDLNPLTIDRITVKVYKPVAGKVELELQEGGEKGDVQYYPAEYTTPNEWQELSFDVSTVKPVWIRAIVVKIHDEEGYEGEPVQMYWDDVKFRTVYPYPIENGVMTLYNGESVNTFWSDQASAVVRGFANPEQNGINPSATCVYIVRTNSGDTGAFDYSGGAFWRGSAEEVSIAPEYDRMSVMVKKDSEGPVRLELQADGHENIFVSADYKGSHVGEWQRLDFVLPERDYTIDAILIAPHCTTENIPDEGLVCYWDNLIAYKASGNSVLSLNDDNTEVSLTDGVRYGSVTINRTLKADVWNTFCVPFDMTPEQLNDNGISLVKGLTSVVENDGNMILDFSEAENGVEAGKPYIVKVDGERLGITVDGVEIKSATPSSVSDENNLVTMVANYGMQSVPQGTFFISDDQFWKADVDDVELKGYRAYIRLNDNAAEVNRMLISIDGNATRVDNVPVADGDKVDVYTLSGIKVKAGVSISVALDGLQKGIYIVNGKKIIK